MHYLNYPEEMKLQEASFLIREMMSSIREINKRMNELKWVINKNFCSEESNKEIKDKLFRMNKTKFNIMFSVHDVFASTGLRNQERLKRVFGSEGLYSALRKL